MKIASCSRYYPSDWSLFRRCIDRYLGFLRGSDDKESACNAGDSGLIPGSGRSLGAGNGSPLQWASEKRKYLPPEWMNSWRVEILIHLLDVSHVFIVTESFNLSQVSCFPSSCLLSLVPFCSLAINWSLAGQPIRSQVILRRGANNLLLYSYIWGFPGGTSGKGPTCQCRRHKRSRFDPWAGKIPSRRVWQSTPAFLPWRIPWTEEFGGTP